MFGPQVDRLPLVFMDTELLPKHGSLRSFLCSMAEAVCNFWHRRRRPVLRFQRRTFNGGLQLDYLVVSKTETGVHHGISWFIHPCKGNPWKPFFGIPQLGARLNWPSQRGRGQCDKPENSGMNCCHRRTVTICDHSSIVYSKQTKNGGRSDNL